MAVHWKWVHSRQYDSGPFVPPRYEVPNRVFATRDKMFLGACQKVGIPPTTRQASKWRNKKGKAWLFR